MTLITAIVLASFVNRWGPIEEMRPPLPELPKLVTPPPTLPAPHASAPHHQHRDICARHGGHRVDYTKNHWRYWRCVFP